MTIRSKLTIAFLIIVALMSGTLYGVAIHLVSSAWETAKSEDVRWFVQNGAIEISNWLARKTREISALGQYHGFRTNNYAVLKRELESLRSPLNGFITDKDLIVVNQYGQIIYSDRLVPENSYLSLLLTEALRTVTETRGMYVRTFNKEDTKDHALFLAAPRWTEQGTLLGTVNAIIDFSRSQMGGSLRSLRTPSSSGFALFDSSGSILFTGGHEGNETLIENVRALTKSSDTDGNILSLDGMLVAHKRIPEVRWIFSVWQSEKELRKEIRSAQETTIWIGIVGMIGSFLVVFFVARSFSKPIERLIEKTTELKNGSFIPLQEDVSGEIGQLTKSFNEMAASLQKSQRKLQVLNELGEAIISDIRLNNILERMCNKVAETMEVESCSIYLIDPDGVLRIKASVGLSEKERQELQFKVGEGLTGRVFEAKKGLIVNDVATDSRAKYIPHRRGARKLLSLPLLIRDEPRGVMNTHNKKDGSDFTEEDLELLTIFASQATVAVENFRLFREVSKELQQVTELQTQLIQSEKLSAIGQLVAGVAHELNNPLGIILGYADLLRRQTNDSSVQKSLNIIIQSTTRAAGIVKNLLRFARKQEPNLIPVNLNDVIQSVQELLHHQLKVNNILVFTDFDDSIGNVRADIQQLQQVFFNLLTNAMQAMEGMKDARIVIETRQDNDTVIASITDNGPGIKPEHLTKLFEPFFTTKPVGKGTGLGLSICYGIIKEFGGEITVTSSPGKGATFVVELPVIRAESHERHTHDTLPSEELFVLPYAVLVVDDEENLRSMLKDILESYGCRVTTVESGNAALHILKEQQFDVIVSDFKMPGMNGREFYEECVRLYPVYSKRFVFSSGDIVGEELRRFLESIGAYVIHKPFAVQEILSKVRSVTSKSR